MLGYISQLQQERKVSKEAASSLAGKKRISFLSDAHTNAVASRPVTSVETVETIGTRGDRGDRGDDQQVHVDHRRVICRNLNEKRDSSRVYCVRHTRCSARTAMLSSRWPRRTNQTVLFVSCCKVRDYSCREYCLLKDGCSIRLRSSFVSFGGLVHPQKRPMVIFFINPRIDSSCFL